MSKITRRLINTLYFNALKHGMYKVATNLDENLRLENKVVMWRLEANFDLATHMKSIKNTKPGDKPSCNCDLCKHMYKLHLYRKARKETLRLIRNIDAYLAKKEELELQSYITEAKKWYIFSSLSKHIPILTKESLPLFKLRLYRHEHACKLKAEIHAAYVQMLTKILSVPSNF